MISHEVYPYGGPSIGNHDDYEVDDIPRIGELVMLEYGHGGNAIQQHYFRVKVRWTPKIGHGAKDDSARQK
jgi:hypothetical protein